MRKCSICDKIIKEETFSYEPITELYKCLKCWTITLKEWIKSE